MHAPVVEPQAADVCLVVGVRPLVASEAGRVESVTQASGVEEAEAGHCQGDLAWTHCMGVVVAAAWPLARHTAGGDSEEVRH